MPLFNLKNDKLVPIKEKTIDLEKHLQTLVEGNLQSLFALEFVQTEFNIENFWLDTIAFDPISKSFVVIEYKKVENFSLMDQGQTYLNLLLDHKAEVILEYNEKLGKNLKRAGVDWSQSRVIFVGPRFNAYQKRALRPNLPFELWEVAFYENGVVDLSPLLPISQADKSEKQKPILTGKAGTEIKTFSVEDHLAKTTEDLVDVFESLRIKILELDPEIKEKAVSWYIGYQYKGYLVVYVQFYNDKLMVNMSLEKPDDSKHLLVKAPKSWQGWTKTPQWRFKLTESTQISYLMSLIEQSYKAKKI